MENAAGVASKERKEEMSKYRNIKIHVPTPEISEKVQEKLIEDGCCWGSIGKKVDRTRTPFLYADEYGKILWGTCESDFNGDGRKDVPYQSILDPYYDVKIAWANGEVVQYMCWGDTWYDWEGADQLVLDVHHDWRIKPKAKTIKQWERKHWNGRRVITIVSAKHEPVWDVGFAWLSEPELKEYEVPNE